MGDPAGVDNDRTGSARHVESSRRRAALKQTLSGRCVAQAFFLIPFFFYFSIDGCSHIPVAHIRYQFHCLLALRFVAPCALGMGQGRPPIYPERDRECGPTRRGAILVHTWGLDLSRPGKRPAERGGARATDRIESNIPSRRTWVGI